MRFLARVLIVLGSIGVVVGFFLPFLALPQSMAALPANTFWSAATSGIFQSTWFFWAILGAAILSILVMVIRAKVFAGLLHLILGAGILFLVYQILGTPELQAIFGSISAFQVFWSNLAYGGYLIVGGGAAIFLGGIFELVS